MRYIHESDAEYFEKEEAAIDANGEELCPVCGCCSLVEAEVVPSIFAQLEQIKSGKPPDKRLVCNGGCVRDRRHG